jgi:hypothetical protein
VLQALERLGLVERKDAGDAAAAAHLVALSLAPLVRCAKARKRFINERMKGFG